MADLSNSYSIETREAFVELARAAGSYEVYDGRNKRALCVEFRNGKAGVDAATRTLQALQEAGLVQNAEIPLIEPLPGSEARIANATIKVLSGGLTSLYFTPPAELTAAEVTHTLKTAVTEQTRKVRPASHSLSL